MSKILQTEPSHQAPFQLDGWKYIAVLASIALGSLGLGFALGGMSAPMVIVAMPVVLLALVLGLTNPELLAALIIGLNWGYISSVAVKFHNTPSLIKPLVVFLILVLLLRRFTGRRTPLVYHSIQWWILAYFVMVSAGLWYAQAPDRTMGVVIEVAKQLMFFFVAVNLISSKRILEVSILLMLFVGAAIASLTIYQELTHSYTRDFGGFARSTVAQITEELSDRPRAGGPTSDPNVFGQQLLVLVPIGIWLTLSARSLALRLAGGAATLLCLGAIGLTFSRGAYLAVAIMFILYVFHLHLNPRLLLIIPIIWLALSTASPEMRARFGTLNSLLPNNRTAQQDASLERRSVEMLMAVYMFLDHPIIGVGADNYVPLYPVYVREHGGNVPDEQRNAHSLYLEVAAEHGIIGLCIVGAIIVIVLRSLQQARRWFAASGEQYMAELSVALLIGFSGFLVSAIFLHNDYPDFFWTQVVLAVATALIAANEYRRVHGHAPPTTVEATQHDVQAISTV